MGCAFLECLVEENPPQKWVAFLGLDRLKLKMMLGRAAAKEGCTVQMSEGPVFSQVIWRNGLFAIGCKKKRKLLSTEPPGASGIDCPVDLCVPSQAGGRRETLSISTPSYPIPTHLPLLQLLALVHADGVLNQCWLLRECHPKRRGVVLSALFRRKSLFQRLAMLTRSVLNW